MRWLLFAAALWLGACVELRAADEPFPYRAVVTGDELSVRAGPGENYYSVQKLTRGEVVEVWRHDPGGWYAIRPPAGAFSWVAGEFIKPGNDGLGLVNGDRVVSRVGSVYSDIRDVIQVRLDRGEEVEILDVQRTNTPEGPRTWYKIAPPAGEFRWVPGRFLEHESRAKRQAADTIAVQPTPSTNSSTPPSVPSTTEPTIYDKAKDPSATPPADTPPPGDAPAAVTGAGAEKVIALERKLKEMATQIEQLTGKRPSPGWIGKDGSTVEMRQIPAPRAATVPEQLAELDLRLSQIIADDTLAWDFRQLTTRVEEILARADSAAERGQARALLVKIEKFEDIRLRYQEVVAQRNNVSAPARSSVSSRLARRVELKTDEGGEKYDGIGRLTQVTSQKPGAPQFALLDDNGRVLYYVSPAPGVNLRAYLDRDVGVTGILGYLPEQETRHVTAKRVEPLDGRKLR